MDRERASISGQSLRGHARRGSGSRSVHKQEVREDDDTSDE